MDLRISLARGLLGRFLLTIHVAIAPVDGAYTGFSDTGGYVIRSGLDLATALSVWSAHEPGPSRPSSHALVAGWFDHTADADAGVCRHLSVYV
jgi:hypothetical protein